LIFLQRNSDREIGSVSDNDTLKGDGSYETAAAVVESETVPLNGVNITVKYPSLETDASADQSSTDDNTAVINSRLREAAIEKLYDQYLEDESGEFTYDITETALYTSSGVISSVSKGSLHAESAVHDYIFAYSVNIDEDTGELYTFSDIIIDFDYFKKVFLKGKFTLAEGQSEVVDDLGLEYLMKQCSEEYGIYPDIYMDGDLIGVILEVPYAVGSTAIFTIDKSELTRALAPRFQ
jgi:hypothetical protein